MKMPLKTALIALALFSIAECLANPAITKQPSPATNSVSLGVSLTNRVSASTSNPPLAYQWRHNGVDIPGAATNTLALMDIGPDQAGVYSVMVTDASGSTLSKGWTVVVDATFRKIMSGPIVAESNTFCAVWADMNNDQWPDLVTTDASGAATIFQNNGDGTFTKLSATGLTPVVAGSAVVVADIDNDGWLDVVTVGSGKQSLFRNDGAGNFQQVDDSPVSLANAKSITTAWADFDNDGKIDLFIGADKNYFFHNTGEGSFTNMPTSAVVGPHAGAQSCAWGDYNNDGYPDLYVCNAPNQKNYLFRNNGDGTFTRILNDPCVADVANFSGCAWGDYDNDGYLDLFVSAFGPRNFLYHNERNGTFKKVTTTLISSDAGHSYGSAWVDYDNDGNLDLYVANGGNDFAGVRNDFLYHNLGNGKFARVLTGSLVNEEGWTYGATWGDYNRDGFQDMFAGNIYDTGNNVLFQNSGNSNNWLTVSCAGRISNRAAIGTKVRVKATIRGEATWQMREISGGSGVGGQPELAAAFGLGDATNIDLVRVEWPSGLAQEFTNVGGRQFLKATEPSRLALKNPGDGGAVQVELWGGSGVVYRLEKSEDLLNWSSVASLTNRTGRIAWTNSPSASEGQRYYRASEF